MDEIRQKRTKNRITEQAVRWTKEHVETDKKSCLTAGILTILFLVLWKVLPKDFSTLHSRLLILFAVDCLLCLSLAIRIKIPEKWQGYLAFFLFLAAPAINIFNAEYVVQNRVRDMVLLILALTYGVCLLLYLVLYVIIHRVRIALFVGMLILTIFGLANSFIVEFRGNGIRAADIYAVKTAANVAGGYHLIFTEYRATAILIACGFLFLTLHCRYKKTGWKARIPSVAVTLVAALVLQGIFWNKQFMEDNWIVPYKWELAASAKYHGAILEFAAGIPYLKVEKPDGYSAKKAKEEVESCQNTDPQGLKVANNLNGKKPDIIAIMNESYSNLGILGDVETDVPYREYYDSLSENVIKGMTSVPVLGGLTANSEFEFMTGYSMAFFPTGTIAYQNYVKNNTHNLNEYLKDQGYYSLFMHPMNGSGWNRKNVYTSFGFDEQIYLDDYTNRDTFRGMVTDSSNYKEVIERYEEAKKENDHVFIFNVTMQNHGGYASGVDTTVHLTNTTGSYPTVEEYLTVAKMSDDALKELITYFSQKEDPVVICMFGDH